MKSMLSMLALCAASHGADLHGASDVPSGWRATGRPAPSGMVFHNVMLGLKRSNRAAVKKLVAEVSDPRGAKYQQYPSYEEMGALVRPAAHDTAAVKAWLAEHGVQVVFEHPHGDYIKVSATAAQLEMLVGREVLEFEHTESGKRVHRVVDGVRVPDEVAAALDTITGFTSFPLMSGVAVKADPTSADGTCAVTPPVVRATYNVTGSAAADGTKKNIQAIAQFEGEYVSDRDLAGFCKKFDPTTGKCAVSKYVGDKNEPLEPGVESMLDTEYIVSVSGGHETWVYTYTSLDFCGNLHTFGSDVTGESPHPSVISISYGSQLIGMCQAASMSRFADDVEKMAGLGITVMISSGDDGSGHFLRQGVNTGKLAPAYPASIPHAIAVGATYWAEGTSGAEEATTSFGSGGGFSYDFDVPDYQKDVTAAYLSSVPDLPTLGYAKTGRGSPDVSALGEQFAVWWYGTLVGGCVAGTSASSPSFAAIVSRLNDECAKAGGKSLGFANPLFYQNPGMFRDVTLGTNAIAKNTQGWKAVKGWDASTGLGSPDFPAMVKVVREACGSVQK